MKKINFFCFFIAFSLLMSCGDDTEVDTTENIVADFSFTSDRSTFTFTNLSEGATSYKWDFGDLYFYSYEENPVYSYDIKGGELTVTLTAYNDAGGEVYTSKSIVAPIVITTDIEIDGDFEEWDVVPYSEEFPDATIKKMKFYTKGANISIYFEGNKDMTLEVVDMQFNTDGNRDTGYTERWMSLGADYLFEGSLSGQIPLFSHSGVGGGFSYNWIGPQDSFETSGVISLDDETNAIEFSFPKSIFGTLGGDTLELGIWLNWGAEFIPKDVSGQPIIIYLK
ncbi:PKD domain-containing protein [uncultured Polaribacter sp.]|uniref:PKD domain-containing protein n=1 Tax=uncultured Polaribacter sp. TaxID=174711 RepID=UPI00261054E6|nr:PKD domain-containing protein [uncultured Polaribacter sp.]